jgi:anion-transporting  ArsA/GET3 family ATPase
MVPARARVRFGARVYHRDMGSSLGAARVAIVSGKGGTGKTTVAAALAVAAARAGRHVLLAEIEDRQAFAPLFGLTEISYEERVLAPNLVGQSIEADESLVEYLQKFYGIPRLSRALVHSKAIDFATNTAPGLRDILLIGKVLEAENRRAPSGKHVFDLVVVDGPPTGRLPRFLEAPRAIIELVHGGPIRTQAQLVYDMVVDPQRCQVLLVTQAEDMAARETVEAAETLEKMNVAVGPVIVNGVWPELKGIGRNVRAQLAADATKSSIELSDEALDALATIASTHARRAKNQWEVIGDLREHVRVPMITLPYLFADRLERAQLNMLADFLEPSL